jgi:Icc-related predicted phosphoesterase
MVFRRRKKASAQEGTKIFFCTDIHGSNVCFKKFINAADFYGSRILILGGDVTGKMVVPIARQTSGAFLTTFAGQDMQFTSEDEVNDFIKRSSNMGFYPRVMTEDEFQETKSSPDAQETLFRQLIRERLEEWISYAEDKLAGTDVQVFAAPGNDDFFEVDEILASSEKISLLEMQVHQLTDHHEIVTTGWTNYTPWNTERECSEEELEDRLRTMVEKVNDLERCIFNIHCPPYNSRIDVCPKLDDELRVVYEMGNPVLAPAGSTAVRKLIEEAQPLVGLHGHIHEARGEVQIGRTLCLNPGSVYSEGVLNGVLVTLSESEVQDHQFTQG